MCRDWESYVRLTDEDLTCFEPETRDQIVTGRQFHKFYFQDSRRNSAKPNFEIVSPDVKLFKEGGAVISYIKKVSIVSESDTIVLKDAKETRVWKLEGENWKCIHFHRS